MMRSPLNSGRLSHNNTANPSPLPSTRTFGDRNPYNNSNNGATSAANANNNGSNNNTPSNIFVCVRVRDIPRVEPLVVSSTEKVIVAHEPTSAAIKQSLAGSNNGGSVSTATPRQGWTSSRQTPNDYSIPDTPRDDQETDAPPAAANNNGSFPHLTGAVHRFQYDAALSSVRPEVAINMPFAAGNGSGSLGTGRTFGNSNTTSSGYDNINPALLVPPVSSQQDVFDLTASKALDACLSGINSCVFAYGQTGSGKTYTLFGDTTNENHDPGVVPRTCYDLFERLNKMKEEAIARQRQLNKQRRRQERAAEAAAAAAAEGDDAAETPTVNYDDLSDDDSSSNDEIIDDTSCFTAQVGVGFFEIYNEEVTCLLSGKNKLQVRQDAKTGAPFVDGLHIKYAESAEDIKPIVSMGLRKRHTAETAMNCRSSRSHAVFQLHVKIGTIGTQENSRELRELTAVLNLVDLAGAERQSTAAPGGANPGSPYQSHYHQSQTAKEGTHINLSLLHLAKVIGDCERGVKHVNYRNSKLTFLLKENLGGNSKTFMIATVSPTVRNYHETVSTLRYAVSVRAIKNTPVVNQRVRLKGDLEKENLFLKQQYELLLDEKDQWKRRYNELCSRHYSESETLVSQNDDFSKGFVSPRFFENGNGDTDDLYCFRAKSVDPLSESYKLRHPPKLPLHTMNSNKTLSPTGSVKRARASPPGIPHTMNAPMLIERFCDSVDETNKAAEGEEKHLNKENDDENENSLSASMRKRSVTPSSPVGNSDVFHIKTKLMMSSTSFLKPRLVGGAAAALQDHYCAIPDVSIECTCASGDTLADEPHYWVIAKVNRKAILGLRADTTTLPVMPLAVNGEELDFVEALRDEEAEELEKNDDGGETSPTAKQQELLTIRKKIHHGAIIDFGPRQTFYFVDFGCLDGVAASDSNFFASAAAASLQQAGDATETKKNHGGATPGSPLAMRPTAFLRQRSLMSMLRALSERSAFSRTETAKSTFSRTETANTAVGGSPPCATTTVDAATNPCTPQQKTKEDDEEQAKLRAQLSVVKEEQPPMTPPPAVAVNTAATMTPDPWLQQLRREEEQEEDVETAQDEQTKEASVEQREPSPENQQMVQEISALRCLVQQQREKIEYLNDRPSTSPTGTASALNTARANENAKAIAAEIEETVLQLQTWMGDDLSQFNSPSRSMPNRAVAMDPTSPDAMVPQQSSNEFMAATVLHGPRDSASDDGLAPTASPSPNAKEKKATRKSMSVTIASNAARGLADDLERARSYIQDLERTISEARVEGIIAEDNEANGESPVPLPAAGSVCESGGDVDHGLDNGDENVKEEATGPATPVPSVPIGALRRGSVVVDEPSGYRGYHRTNTNCSNTSFHRRGSLTNRDGSPLITNRSSMTGCTSPVSTSRRADTLREVIHNDKYVKELKSELSLVQCRLKEAHKRIEAEIAANDELREDLSQLQQKDFFADDDFNNRDAEIAELRGLVDSLTAEKDALDKELIDLKILMDQEQTGTDAAVMELSKAYEAALDEKVTELHAAQETYKKLAMVWKRRAVKCALTVQHHHEDSGSTFDNTIGSLELGDTTSTQQLLSSPAPAGSVGVLSPQSSPSASFAGSFSTPAGGQGTDKQFHAISNGTNELHAHTCNMLDAILNTPVSINSDALVSTFKAAADASPAMSGVSATTMNTAVTAVTDDATAQTSGELVHQFELQTANDIINVLEEDSREREKKIVELQKECTALNELVKEQEERVKKVTVEREQLEKKLSKQPNTTINEASRRAADKLRAELREKDHLLQSAQKQMANLNAKYSEVIVRKANLKQHDSAARVATANKTVKSLTTELDALKATNQAKDVELAAFAAQLVVSSPTFAVAADGTVDSLINALSNPGSPVGKALQLCTTPPAGQQAAAAGKNVALSKAGKALGASPVLPEENDGTTAMKEDMGTSMSPSPCAIATMDDVATPSRSQTTPVDGTPVATSAAKRAQPQQPQKPQEQQLYIPVGTTELFEKIRGCIRQRRDDTAFQPQLSRHSALNNSLANASVFDLETTAEIKVALRTLMGWLKILMCIVNKQSMNKLGMLVSATHSAPDSTFQTHMADLHAIVQEIHSENGMPFSTTLSNLEWTVTTEDIFGALLTSGPKKRKVSKALLGFVVWFDHWKVSKKQDTAAYAELVLNAELLIALAKAASLGDVTEQVGGVASRVVMTNRDKRVLLGNIGASRIPKTLPPSTTAASSKLKAVSTTTNSRVPVRTTLKKSSAAVEPTHHHPPTSHGLERCISDKHHLFMQENDQVAAHMLAAQKSSTNTSPRRAATASANNSASSAATTNADGTSVSPAAVHAKKDSPTRQMVLPMNNDESQRWALMHVDDSPIAADKAAGINNHGLTAFNRANASAASAAVKKSLAAATAATAAAARRKNNAAVASANLAAIYKKRAANSPSASSKIAQVIVTSGTAANGANPRTKQQPATANATPTPAAAVAAAPRTKSPQIGVRNATKSPTGSTRNVARPKSPNTTVLAPAGSSRRTKSPTAGAPAQRRMSPGVTVVRRGGAAPAAKVASVVVGTQQPAQPAQPQQAQPQPQPLQQKPARVKSPNSRAPPPPPVSDLAPFARTNARREIGSTYLGQFGCQTVPDSARSVGLDEPSPNEVVISSRGDPENSDESHIKPFVPMLNLRKSGAALGTSGHHEARPLHNAPAPPALIKNIGTDKAAFHAAKNEDGSFKKPNPLLHSTNVSNSKPKASFVLSTGALHSPPSYKSLQANGGSENALCLRSDEVPSGPSSPVISQIGAAVDQENAHSPMTKQQQQPPVLSGRAGLAASPTNTSFASNY